MLTRRRKRPVIGGVSDATDLERFEYGFITKIVTDPPWGFYENIRDINRFYRDLLAELVRVRRAQGIIVLLIGEKRIADQLVAGSRDVLSLCARYEIRVNGKKVSLLKWRRTGGLCGESLSCSCP